MGMGTIWHWIHWIQKFQVITSHYILNWYVMYTYMCVLILYCYRLLYELYDLTSTSSGPDPSNSLCSAPSYSLIGDSAQPNRSIAPAKLSTSPWPGDARCNWAAARRLISALAIAFWYIAYWDRLMQLSPSLELFILCLSSREVRDSAVPIWTKRIIHERRFYDCTVKSVFITVALRLRCTSLHIWSSLWKSFQSFRQGLPWL